MTVTTAETLTVDGVVLNTLAKNIESLSGRLKVPPLRTGNITVPGRHGTLRTSRKLYEEGEIVLPMWVRGVDDDGNFSSRQKFYENIDILTNLFRPGSGQMLEVVHTLADGSSRKVFAECTEAIDFTMTGRTLGKFSVALRVPSVFWVDPQQISVDLTMGSAGPIAQLSGTTAPIEDAVFTIIGPATNCRVEAYYDGKALPNPNYFQYNAAIPAGQSLVVDCSTWNLYGNNGLVVDYTNFYQVGGARWLTLVPGRNRTPPAARVIAANPDPAVSRVRVQAQRKFLVG